MSKLLLYRNLEWDILEQDPNRVKYLFEKKGIIPGHCIYCPDMIPYEWVIWGSSLKSF